MSLWRAVCEENSSSFLCVSAVCFYMMLMPLYFLVRISFIFFHLLSLPLFAFSLAVFIFLYGTFFSLLLSVLPVNIFDVVLWLLYMAYCFRCTQLMHPVLCTVCYLYIYIYMCICVFLYIYVYVYICIYMCICLFR